MQGNPHRGDAGHNSFRSQISSVFRVEGTDLYIAVADRWLPECSYAYEDYRIAFERRFIKGEAPRAEEEKFFADVAANTSLSDYVWLPIRFEGDTPVIEWHDEWKIEDFI